MESGFQRASFGYSKVLVQIPAAALFLAMAAHTKYFNRDSPHVPSFSCVYVSYFNRTEVPIVIARKNSNDPPITV